MKLFRFTDTRDQTADTGADLPTRYAWRNPTNVDQDQAPFTVRGEWVLADLADGCSLDSDGTGDVLGPDGLAYTLDEAVGLGFVVIGELVPRGMAYTVREPGMTAWAGPGLSAEEALRDLAGARREGLHRARIYTDEDAPRDVTDDLGARDE